jgi:hypothetical protein
MNGLQTHQGTGVAVRRDPIGDSASADRSLTERADDARHLVSGVVADAKELASSYGELIRHDLREQLDRTRRALLASIVAAHAAGAGLLLLAMAGAHGLSIGLGWSLAVSYALFGAVVVIVALALTLVTRHASQRIETPPALEEAKEDAAWIQERT